MRIQSLHTAHQLPSSLQELHEPLLQELCPCRGLLLEDSEPKNSAPHSSVLGATMPLEEPKPNQELLNTEGGTPAPSVTPA